MTKSAGWPLLGAAFLVLVSPVATSQTAVDGCSQQCRPSDPDVNDPAVRESGTANVILYAHFFDPYGAARLGILVIDPPDAEHEPDLNYGFLVPTVDTDTGTPADVNFENNAFEAFTLRSRLLEWHEGSPRLQHDHLPYGSLRLGEGPVVVYAYFSADALPSSNLPLGQGGSSGVGAVPVVFVEATWGIREEGGRVTELASSVTEPFKIVTAPGAPGVYEVRLELEPDSREIESCYANPFCRFTVRAYQVSNEAGQVMQRDWRIRTGPDYPWRLILPLEDPLRTVAASVSPMDSGLGVRWFLDAMLGFPDIDADSARLVLRDAEGTVLFDEAPKTIRKPYSSVDVPPLVNLTWVVSARDVPSGVPLAGELSVLNGQGTYRLRHPVEVPPLGDDGARLPAPPAVALLASVAVLAWAALRRGRAEAP